MELRLRQIAEEISAFLIRSLSPLRDLNSKAELISMGEQWLSIKGFDNIVVRDIAMVAHSNGERTINVLLEYKSEIKRVLDSAKILGFPEMRKWPDPKNRWEDIWK